jgi:hypothetical protein
LTFSLCGQEVVFSRRLYKEQGQSYQQIWSWNAATGVLRELTHSARDHFHPACRGSSVIFASKDARLWKFNPASGEERIIGPSLPPADRQPEPRNGCAVFAKAGNLEACGKGEDLSVLRDNKEIGHFKTDECPIDDHGTLGKCVSPIQSLEWATDAKWLLVGALEDLHEWDYYVVNPAAMKLSRVATAFPDSAFWLPGRQELLYTTPEYVAPLPGAPRERQVWVQQLIRFDPATGKNTPITSGVTNNLDASLCNP